MKSWGRVASRTCDLLAGDLQAHHTFGIWTNLKASIQLFWLACTSRVTVGAERFAGRVR